MAENKTKETDTSVKKFLNGVADEQQRKDSLALVELMQAATKLPPKMWGSAIVGFGSYHYKYESGREGDSPLVGFSPRKGTLTLYVRLGTGKQDELLEKLGKHTTGKGCLYIKKLEDVHLPTLKKIVQQSVKSVGK